MTPYDIRDVRLQFRTLLRDPDMEVTYRSNVAMLLNDRYGITDHETRNRAAAEILSLICHDDYIELQKKHDREPKTKFY